MGNRTRVSMMAPRIGRKLKKNFPLVFRASQLAEIFHEFAASWRLPRSTNIQMFIDGLLDEGELDHIILDFGADSFEVFFLPNISKYHLISYGVPRAYLSHHSALYLWKLVPENQNTIYVNQEQSAAPSKGKKNTLTQSAIDVVFSKPQRESQSIATFQDINIQLLKGKSTGKLGVIELGNAKRERVIITDVERTLIDCVVRSSYAGGSGNVLNAFFQAKKRNIVSPEIIADYLSELNYVYPYHQCVGFYMQMAGNYSEQEISLFEEQKTEYNFYLEYNAQNLNYDARWRIHYPANLGL